jgi:hypothetical protein
MRAPGPTAHYLKQPRNQKPLLIRQLKIFVILSASDLS